MPKTTPLLEALKAEKSAHKDKEAILRNHSHYKDQPAGLNSTPRKDDPKRKGGPTPIPKTVLTTPDAGNVATPGGGGGKKSQKKGHSHTPNAVVAALPPMVAPKAIQINTAAKNINVPPIPPPAPKSPKMSRAPRLPPQPKAAAATKVIPPPSTPDAPIVALLGQAAPTSTPRRARPVVGLGSRQFEAALNGAGVSAPGERKSRREREREKEREEKEAAAEPSAVNPSGPVPAETKPVHLSPRRDRGQRKEPPQAQAADGARAGIPASAIGVEPLDLAKVPGILQCEGLPLDNDSSVTVPIRDTGAPPFHGGRGGRRGRGRGRGARGG